MNKFDVFSIFSKYSKAYTKSFRGRIVYEVGV